MNKTSEKSFSYARYIAVIAFFACLAFIRLLNLDGDTPLGISAGQELNTDPPQYTSFARNKILYGEWEIFHTRYILFVKNITTSISYIIFKMLGTGRAQAGLVAVLLSLVSISFCFSIWVKKGFVFALTASAILGFNYIFLSYGKLPFLEITTISLITIGGYLLLRIGRRNLLASLSGVLMAAAAFYCKLLAIAFLPISIVVLLVELSQEDDKTIYRKFNPLYSFLCGYGTVFLSWLLFVYLPTSRITAGYLSEISTGMYGAPKALESAKMFLAWLFSYGFDIRLWSRQPVTFATGFLGAALVCGMIFAPTKQMIKKIDRVDLFYLLWFLGAFALLFPWNYRPMRYALLLFPALSYLSARWIFLIFDSQNTIRRRHWPSLLLSFLAGWFITFHFLIMPQFESRSLDLIFKYLPTSIFGGIFTLLLAMAIHRLNLKKFLTSPKGFPWGKLVSGVVIIGILVIQISLVLSNSFKGQRSFHNASVDLGQILSPDAVVIGSYSSALTQENRLKSVIKMFGVPVVEKDFFEKIPATHVAIEAGGGPTSQEGRAFGDYPAIMKDAPLITTYFLRGYPVNVYLVSETNPNPISSAYRPSQFEKAAIELHRGNIDSALFLLSLFEMDHPNSLSAQAMRMKISLNKGNYAEASKHLRNMLTMDKNNLNILLMLGDAYLKSKPPNLNEAYKSYLQALELRPDDRSLKRQVQILSEYQRSSPYSPAF